MKIDYHLGVINTNENQLKEQNEQIYNESKEIKELLSNLKEAINSCSFGLHQGEVKDYINNFKSIVKEKAQEINILIDEIKYNLANYLSLGIECENDKNEIFESKEEELTKVLLENESLKIQNENLVNENQIISQFLIENKNEKILFDLGIGDEPVSYVEGEGSGGELLNNLERLGVDRHNITKVIISHFHPSHTGWVSIKEKRKRVLTFPNAEYYCSEQEWEFWKDKTEGPISIDPVKIKKPLENKIKFLKNDQEIIPNLYVKFVFGHTPGLINLILKTDDKSVWFMSDIVHSDLEFEFPLGFFFVDNNEEKAYKTRRNLFDELSKPNTIIANGHFIEEAFGYLKKDKENEGKYKYERYTT